MPPPRKFDGVIGGPPCQSFSVAIASRASDEDPTGSVHAKYQNLVPEFERVVGEADPEWWISENVKAAPIPQIGGLFAVWEELLEAWEFGAHQHRERRFCSNIYLGEFLSSERVEPARRHPDPWPCVTATEYKCSAGSNQRTMRQRAGRKVGRCMTLAEVNVAMGLPEGWETPCLTRPYQYSVRGNGVPIQLGRAVARAIKHEFYGGHMHDGEEE